MKKTENQTITKVKKTIQNNNLITAGDYVLVGLSGGADSVFLLHALIDLSGVLDFKIAACHIEHGIRGKSSIADMCFSKKLCEQKNIPFHSKSFDVPAIAKAEHISCEAAGRKVRYEYFSEIIKTFGYTKLATAHHRDDKAETLLMNIIRGCSLRGFAAIEYKNGNIIRPLLNLSKAEILNYLDNNNISFCTDETNSDTQYTRNKIRHQLMPMLKTFNPSVEEALQRQSEVFTDEDEYMNLVACKAFDSCKKINGIDISLLLSYHKAIRRRVMYMYLSFCRGTSANISFKDVETALMLCESEVSGKRCKISENTTIGIEYGVFSVFADSEILDYEYELTPDKSVVIKEAGIKVTLNSTGGNLQINKDDKIVIRNRRNGDYFYPVGMLGKKKIKDYFIDKKIPREKRDTIPLLVINGEVASVIGYRNDRRFFYKGCEYVLVSELI